MVPSTWTACHHCTRNTIRLQEDRVSNVGAGGTPHSCRCFIYAHTSSHSAFFLPFRIPVPWGSTHARKCSARELHTSPSLVFFYFSYSGLEAKLEVLLTESARGETQKWPSAATERENRSQAEAKASHISPLRPRQGSSSPLPRLKGRGLCSRASSNSLSASNSMDQSPRGGPRPGLGGCPHR